MGDCTGDYYLDCSSYVIISLIDPVRNILQILFPDMSRWISHVWLENLRVWTRGITYGQFDGCFFFRGV